MVIIRFSRHGSKRRPFYQIVAADNKSPRDGKFIENLGYYNIHNKDEIKLDMERVSYWLSKGAQLSDAVKKLVKQQSKAA